MKFPKNFLWGASSAAYQIEGAVNEDGRGKIIWDELLHKNMNISFENANGDVAADHYHRYKEDVALMAEMGFKAYRFSIAWSRIVPKGDFTINKKGLEFYKNLIAELKKYNITPIVTMHHFDSPLSMDVELKDWTLNPEFTNRFLFFAKTLFIEFGKDVKHWIVFNEPNGYALMYSRMGIAGGPKGRKPFYDALFRLAYTQAKTIELFRDMKCQGTIGSSIAEMYGEPLDQTPSSIKAHAYYNTMEFEIVHDIFGGKAPSKEFLKIIKDENIEPSVDMADFSKVVVANQPTFIGVNYYQTFFVGVDDSNTKAMEDMDISVNNSGKKGIGMAMGQPGKWKTVSRPDVKISDWGWNIYPQGLTNLLVWLEKRYKLPTYITENGLGAKDVLTSDNKVHDDYRIDYLRQHIEACANAIAKGSQLIAFCPWSVVDLFSWMNGYQKRYGFVYINRTEHDLKDLARIRKDSFFWYKKVIASNGDDTK